MTNFVFAVVGQAVSPVSPACGRLFHSLSARGPRVTRRVGTTEDGMDRQKVLIIFGAAWVSAALLTWIFISKTHGSKAQATRRVVVASRDLPLGTRIRKPDIKMVEALDKDLPKGGL